MSEHGNMAIGTSYWAKGDFDKAFDCYTKSLRICEKTGDTKGVASCYTNIGNIHRNQGDYERAFNATLKLNMSVFLVEHRSEPVSQDRWL